MSDNMTIENHDLGSVAIGNNEYQSGKVKFPGADTYKEGTIMSLKKVEDAVTVTADVGNTGNGTVASSVASGEIVPIPGDYNLECTYAVTEGGVFKLEDPNGNIIADNLTLRVGSGLTTNFVEAGLNINVTDGATDFSAGDKFELAVTADGEFVVYEVDGKGGAQFLKRILNTELTTTGAESIASRLMISGKVRADKLIIHGFDPGVGITDIIKDQLRDYGFIPMDSKNLSLLDNQ